jgi:hypothetical protein
MVGLRLVLPDGTPPGSYRGTLRLGKREIRLEAEVGSDAALTLIPGTVRAVGASGGTVSAGLTAVNTGNVAVALPERQGVGLFTTQGLDRALGRALSGTAERGLEHFEALGSALADEHGGIMEVRTDGGGALAPGQTRAITIEMSPPSSLRAGETYFGFWLAGGSRVQIELQTQEAEPEEEPR